MRLWRSVPKRRSRKQISQALSKLNAKVSACGKQAGLFPGENVDITLSIGAGGRVNRVDVKGRHAKAKLGQTTASQVKKICQSCRGDRGLAPICFRWEAGQVNQRFIAGQANRKSLSSPKVLESTSWLYVGIR